MKRWTPLLVSVALVAGFAFAASVNVTTTTVYQALFRPWSQTTSQLPSASAHVGYEAYDSTKSALTVSDGTIWRSASPMVGSVSYDFPALSSLADSAPACAETSAITVTGATPGDGCIGSSNLGMDGGAGLSTEAFIVCRVSATNAAKVKLCVSFTDGGSYNLGDAGWYARVFH